MPYFTWRGVTIRGDIKKGHSFARNEQELQTILLARDIAMLSHREARFAWFTSPITLSIKIHFFQLLGSLLSSGVLLPQALRIVAAQLDHRKFQEIVHALSDAVHAGSSLSQAMAAFPAIFSPLMMQVAYVGQESGRLAAACQVLCAYLAMVDRFKRSVRSALMMPILTLVSFILIALVMIVWVVPQFALLFSSLHAQLPGVTRFLLAVSDALRGRAILIFLGSMVVAGVLLRTFMQTVYGRQLRDRMVLHIPGVTSCILDMTRLHLVRSLAALTQAGIGIPLALRIASGAVSNSALRHSVMYLEHAVRSGDSLSRAMLQHPDQLFEQHTIAMIKVGEESGEISAALASAAQYYQDRIERQLHWCATMIQPTLIMLLGVLIAFFVCAIYMPLLNLAHAL